MCGPAGSGKSTHASALEQQGFTRLSLDEEAWRHGYRSEPLPERIARALEDDLRVRLVQLLSEDRDVVVDLSFWSRTMRNEYRDLVRSCGAEAQVVYVDTPRDVVMERLRSRRGTSPNEVRLTEQQAAAYFDGFEVPTADEGPLLVVPYEGGRARPRRTQR